MARFLALLGPPDQLAALERHAGAVADAHGLAPAFAAPRAQLFATPAHTTRLGDGGAAVGALFGRPLDRQAPRDAPTGPDPGALIHGYWGAYVAATATADGASLLRAPLGELGCYYWSDGAMVVAASDMALLAGWAGEPPAIDWNAVGRHLLTSELRAAETCLSGIRELPGGDRLVVGAAGVRSETRWSPWAAVPESSPASFEEAAAGLHDVALACVGGWGQRFGRVLVGLSGGLDSSIVAAALARAGAAFECVTFVTEDSTGDERIFARRVAAHLGVPLTEANRELSGIDLSRSNAAHLPRPTGRSFAQESERIALAVAHSAGADAIFRGGGGDNVFCYLQSVRPIVDRIRVEGWGYGIFASMLDLCRLTGCGLGEVAGRTLRQLRRPVRYPLSPDTALLAPELAASAEAPGHRWLDAPAHALPGQAAHVALLLAIANHLEPLAPETAMPLLSPLMAQPIVEFCLRVPSWWWFRGGNNRMVARQAFAADLPREIIARRGKGTPDSFAIRLFEAGRPQLRELLLDGLLARHGLIDADAVKRALADERPVVGHGYSRLLQFADVEAWARSWAAR